MSADSGVPPVSLSEEVSGEGTGSRPGEPGGAPAAGAAEGSGQEPSTQPRSSDETAGAADETPIGSEQEPGARPGGSVEPAGRAEEVFDPPFSDHETEADDENEKPEPRQYRPWAGAIGGRSYVELYGRGYRQ